VTSKTTDLAVCNSGVLSERCGSGKMDYLEQRLRTYGQRSKGYSECRLLHKYCVHRQTRLGFFSFFSCKRGYWVDTWANLAKVLKFFLIITFKFSLLPVCKLSFFLRLLASVELTDGEGGEEEPSHTIARFAD
jgi:hypothetical protein